MYEKLTQSYKKRYPFKISCPSYIYPEDYVENIELLSTFVDEIELLYFEGNTPEFLPKDKEVETFASIAESDSLSYNIHLPTDLSVTSDKHEKAVKNIKEIIRRLDILNPSTYTLHLPYTGSGNPSDLWYERAFKCIDQISDVTEKKNISVETLNYNPLFLIPFAESGCSVCLDIGHLILYGFDLLKTFEKFRDKISIIHLHGVQKRGDVLKDHKSLDHLDDERIIQLTEILSGYKGVLSFEVFSFENLKKSLKWFSDNIEI